MDEPKKVSNLSIEELKVIIAEALVDALGVKGTDKASGDDEQEDLLNEEFRLNLFEDD